MSNAILPRSFARRAERGSHLRRIKLMLIWGSYLALAQCVGWIGFFGWHRQWVHTLVALAAVPFAASVIWLARRGRPGLAGGILMAMLLALICTVCLFLDIPSHQAPRSAHHFLLALAAGAYLLLRGSRWWVRHGLMLVFFAVFLLLASTTFGIDSRYALPDEVRVWGTWLNNALSLLTLYMVLYVMHADVAERNAIEQDLRTAVAAGQFELHHQAQVGPRGEVIGAEALLRWRHPRRGLIAPGDFIPLAERSGLILPLGDWVLRRACQHLREWSADPLTAHLVLSVNVSARQFHQPDFVARVLDIVACSGVDPLRLKLELTESMLVNDMDDVVAKMDALKAHGVGFSLDDFGTGYSSLAYLQRLPIDQLKIDQAFVRNVLKNAGDAAIARMVVNLGQNLGLAVIAEGVETEGQRAFLSSVGCHAFQGHLFGKAMPATEFVAFLRDEGAGGRSGGRKPASALRPSRSGKAAKRRPLPPMTAV